MKGLIPRDKVTLQEQLGWQKPLKYRGDMLDAVCAQTLSQQTSMQELIRNCIFEKLQGLPSLMASARLLNLNGVKHPRSVLLPSHNEAQVQDLIDSYFYF